MMSFIPFTKNITLLKICTFTIYIVHGLKEKMVAQRKIVIRRERKTLCLWKWHGLFSFLPFWAGRGLNSLGRYGAEVRCVTVLTLNGNQLTSLNGVEQFSQLLQVRVREKESQTDDGVAKHVHCIAHMFEMYR